MWNEVGGGGTTYVDGRKMVEKWSKNNRDDCSIWDEVLNDECNRFLFGMKFFRELRFSIERKIVFSF